MANLILNGSTSGSVTLSSPAVSGTTTLTLPTTSGTVLTNGTNTNFPAGSVLQVVQTNYSTPTSTTSGTFTDSGLNASITPSSATNKILVLVNQQIRSNKSGANDTGYGFRLVRDSTAIFSRDDSSTASFYLGTSNADIRFANNITYLDSPATTSAITYKTQINSFNTSTVAAQHNSVPSTITLMEIKA
jgi:hypothetical protein